MKKSNFKQAIIILNGDLGDHTHIGKQITPDTFIIAVDGGANLSGKLGVVPHLIIGDFDSVDKEMLANLKDRAPMMELQSYSADKDETDSELALNYLLTIGIKRVIMSGFLGTRVDHMLGNLFLLRKFHHKFDELRIVEASQEMYLIADHATVYGSKDDTVSFMPIAGSVKVKHSSGLVYDLSKYVISQTENPGISNVMTSARAVIDITQGQLLVVHSFS